MFIEQYFELLHESQTPPTIPSTAQERGDHNFVTPYGYIVKWSVVSAYLLWSGRLQVSIQHHLATFMPPIQ